MTQISLEMFRYAGPIVLLSSAVVFILLLLAFFRSHRAIFYLSVLSVVSALILLFRTRTDFPVSITDMLTITSVTQQYWILILSGALVCLLMSFAYIKSVTRFREEWYLLLLISTVGALVLAASHHFAALFIGLELLSVPLYGLAAYALKNKNSLEAGLKYLVLSAVAAAFLLLGMALIYAQTGQMTFSSLPVSYWSLLGSGLILVALGFKLSWAPFHVWAPDVYQGAPMPVTAFLSTVSKVAVVIALMKLMAMLPILKISEGPRLLVWISALSILLGNLLALRQTSFKRLLACSSIAHVGYMMMGFLAYNAQVIWFYWLAYGVSALAGFAVLVALTKMGDDSAGDDWQQLQGLGQRHPFLASVLALSLLSLAGIPLTAGFMAKFLLFAAALHTLQWILLGVAVIGSVIGLCYYLRAAVRLFQPAVIESTSVDVPLLNYVVIALLALLTLFFGILPGSVM